MMQQPEDISTSELFEKMKYWFRYLVSKWLLISVIACIGGALGYFMAFSKKPLYSSEVSFVLSNESGTLPLSILASQFGFGSNSGDVFSSENIISLFQSKTILSRTLFKKATTQETLFDVYARTEKLQKRWSKSTHLKKVFPFPQSALQMTPLQDSVLRSVINALTVKSIVTISRPDKATSMYVVNTTYTNDTFAYFFSKYLVDETSKYYIETKTSLARQNMNLLQVEADSLRRVINGGIRYSASEQDRTFNLNPALQQQRSGIQVSQANLMATQAAYAEVVKSLELSKLDLQKQYPLYQVIDLPSLPLTKITDSKLKSFFLYFTGFGIAAAALILGMHFIKIIKNS